MCYTHYLYGHCMLLLGTYIDILISVRWQAPFLANTFVFETTKKKIDNYKIVFLVVVFSNNII